MSKLTTLKHWVAKNFAQPGAPSPVLVRAWIKSGRIRPTPLLVGKQYLIKEDAELIDRSAGGSLIATMKSGMERRIA